MTVQEARKIFVKQRECAKYDIWDTVCAQYGDSCDGCPFKYDIDECNEARDVAIKSLNAWEWVFADIEARIAQAMNNKESTTSETHKDMWSNEIAIYESIHEMIKKHLEIEVTE